MLTLIILIISQFSSSLPSILFSNPISGQVNNNNSSSSSSNNNDNTNVKTLDYYARYNCGTITNDTGPLRPGKYDSDITIFNKKDFPLTVIWKAIEINQQKKENFNILNIPPENIININCSKIYLQNNLQNNFKEGIVQIRININNGQLLNNFFTNPGESIIISDKEINDLINVDVLHTVNTLSDLNKESFYLKVKFSIKTPMDSNAIKSYNNYTGIFKIKPDQVINPHNFIQDILLFNHLFNKTEINDSKISIINSEIVSNPLTDNHALTIQKIEPIVSS